jgi:hypothetical protein
MGGILGGALGGVGGFFAGNALGGENLSDTLGVQNNYKAGNPYDQSYLLQQIGNQGQIYGGQQSLAQALQAQVAGQGPNPAQTQYLGNVNNNIANAQGLISSQRGLNPALAARMGVNAASQANQQAALGSALLQQQQQLGATQNLGNLYGQMQQGNLGYQGLYNQGALGSQQINAGIATGNTNRNAQLIGGVLNAAGGAASAAAGGAAHGGYVTGGKVNAPGDSPSNDTVHTMLSPGEIVIPRSKAHDPEKAKEFIDHLLKDENKDDSGYGEVLKARRKRKK